MRRRWQTHLEKVSACSSSVISDTSDCDEVDKKLNDFDEKYQQNRISHWLSPSNSSIEYNAAVDKRHPGTCEWLLDHRSFRSWKYGSSPFLWLHGLSGCGKTILATSVVSQSRDDGGVLLFFYFNVSDKGKTSVSQMLRTLITQAQTRSKAVQVELQKLYVDCANGQHQPSTQQLSDGLKTAISALGHVTIVVDALDECKTIKELLAWLKHIRDSTFKHLRLFVTSRKEGELYAAIDDWAEADWCVTIAVQNSHTSADIRNYVRARICDVNEFKYWTRQQDLHARVEESVFEKSDGM